jgi:signal transduction histidine kinase/ActR/RegA family two-component response regulator
LPFFLVTIVIAGTIILWASHFVKRDVEYRLIDTLRHHQDTINNKIKDIEASLGFYGHFMVDTEMLSNRLTDIKTGNAIEIYVINFLMANGMHLHVPHVNDSDEVHADLIRKGLMGLSSIELIEQFTNGKLRLSIEGINPIETPEGIDDAVIIGYPVDQKFLENLKARIGADISLIYKNQIVLSTIKSPSLFQASLDKIKDIPLESIKGNKTYLAEWGIKKEMQKVLFFPFKIDYKKVGVFAVSLPLKEVFYIQRQIFTYAGVFTGLILVMVGFMFIFISRKLTQPIKQLSIAANKIATGDFAQTVEVTSDDEVGNLQFSFNVMAGNLHRVTENLIRSNEEIGEWNRTLEQKVEERAAKLRETQQRLNQAEKLSAIGELVSGVAHEINNPLSAIIGFAEILDMETEDNQIKTDLRKIIQEAVRASKIVKNLLTYARMEGHTKQLTQINDLITQAIELRSYEWRVNNIEIVQDLCSSLSPTMVDPNQIEQVILNILNNAGQAVQEEKKEKAQIRVSSQQRNGQIIIKIGDNGPGIPDESLPKIFDPFYTTKEVGRGTGLGLSVSYGIIKDHGGSIEVETEVGKGSIFTITLPVVEEDIVLSEERQRRQQQQQQQADNHLLMEKRVLVVDDDDEMLNVLSRFLEYFGCIVGTAYNGREAIDRLKNDDFDLIVCDIKMPVMDGKALYAYLVAKMPQMVKRIVFFTGDLIGQDTLHFLRSTGVKWITKPFDVLTIKKVLYEVISACNLEAVEGAGLNTEDFRKAG